MEPLVGGGVTDEIQTFLAFVVGKGLRAPCCWLMSAKKRERALPDRCERRETVFVEANIGVRRLVKKGQPIQIIGLTTKVKSET